MFKKKQDGTPDLLNQTAQYKQFKQTSQNQKLHNYTLCMTSTKKTTNPKTTKRMSYPLVGKVKNISTLLTSENIKMENLESRILS